MEFTVREREHNRNAKHQQCVLCSQRMMPRTMPRGASACALLSHCSAWAQPRPACILGCRSLPHALLPWSRCVAPSRYVSGASIPAYWLANYLWDFLARPHQSATWPPSLSLLPSHLPFSPPPPLPPLPDLPRADGRVPAARGVFRGGAHGAARWPSLLAGAATRLRPGHLPLHVRHGPPLRHACQGAGVASAPHSPAPPRRAPHTHRAQAACCCCVLLVQIYTILFNLMTGIVLMIASYILSARAERAKQNKAKQTLGNAAQGRRARVCAWGDCRFLSSCGFSF